MLEDNQNQISHRKKIIKMNRISNGLFYISVAFNAKEKMEQWLNMKKMIGTRS